MTDEKRKEPRQRRLKAGKIIFNNLTSTMDCQMRDVSASGARLVFESALNTPTEFILLVPGAVEKRWASKIWQTRREVGVALQ